MRPARNFGRRTPSDYLFPRSQNAHLKRRGLGNGGRNSRCLIKVAEGGEFEQSSIVLIGIINFLYGPRDNYVTLLSCIMYEQFSPHILRPSAGVCVCI